MSWSVSSEWWLAELTSDQTYEQVVTPMLIRTLEPEAGLLYADIGCGEGRLMRAVSYLGARVVGVDMTPELALRAPRPVAVAEIPPLPFRDAAVDGALAVLTLEHVSDHVRFFTDLSRVVKAGGTLAVVMNHPVWTSPESTPITDTDGEVLWRPGDYFSETPTAYPVDNGSILFHHRSMAALLNAASQASWGLEHMEESPHHELEDQAGIPRLLACRWRLLP